MLAMSLSRPILNCRRFKNYNLLYSQCYRTHNVVHRIPNLSKPSSLVSARSISNSSSNPTSSTDVSITSTQLELPPSIPPVETFNLSPVDMMQYLLETVHHLPLLESSWFMTIAATTLLFRTLFSFPTAVYQERTRMKMRLVAPIINNYSERMKHQIARDCKKEGKEYKEFIDKYRREHNIIVSQVLDRYNIRPFLAAAFTLTQAPFWIATSFAIQKMAAYPPSIPPMLPVDGFITGGALWFTDLTMPDATFIIPVATGFVYLYNIQKSYSESHRKGFKHAVVKNILRLGTVFITYISIHAPVALPLYWLTSGAYTTFQNWALNRPTARRILNLNLPVFPAELTKAEQQELPDEVVAYVLDSEKRKKNSKDSS
ncbi:60Kd inner membrane protein-domain-containing protein [Paraphysoderma sedebokerense]|nr:60Kd inner membrane protein-domain-containing protein [Paraphysoderma sedebokerense]